MAKIKSLQSEVEPAFLLWTSESYEKNFIHGLRADFTRGCNQSFSLMFPSLSGYCS